MFSPVLKAKALDPQAFLNREPMRLNLAEIPVFRVELLRRQSGSIQRQAWAHESSGRCPKLSMKAGISNQAFRSNWLRSLSAIASIISQRSASRCGPSLMISAFHVSSCGMTEIAKFVGQSH
ncbi:hypothetical protein [Bradyrhizobium elkanii]|uniref:Uncharacterized protein n=1 Tax=Bradyrhizobium elkanii TaxID=29448 RepID=A0A8I2C444_BRAEL|nr:hypothetical protein [Bradyrhizobium elkanii]MBP1294279.1 hypothetical protein [Bradyrhizobium elkanii]